MIFGMTWWIFSTLGIAALLTGGFFLMRVPGVVVDVSEDDIAKYDLPDVPEALISEQELMALAAEQEKKKNGDIANQRPLENPPEVIKAVYATSWSASSQSKMDYLISLINETELNAIIIDIKDYSGIIAYDIESELVEKYGSKEVRISKLNALIKRLHDNNIYVIARITMFQDPLLAGARPDLAVQDSVTGDIWRDNKGLAWIDPGAKEAWEYIVEISRDAAERGFDELNFDYIRFPSDGNLKAMSFTHWDENTLRSSMMRKFFAYLREELEGIRISADLFGLATINRDDLGIGQVLEDALTYFDFVAPMVYPSHYATGFIGYTRPAANPYAVVRYSMEIAVARLGALLNPPMQSASSTQASATTTLNEVWEAEEESRSYGKLRPWLQDFDLGADYTADMVRQQIQASIDAGRRCGSSTIANAYFDTNPNIKNVVCENEVENDFSEYLPGFMLWNPSNIYTKGALKSNEELIIGGQQ